MCVLCIVSAMRVGVVVGYFVIFSSIWGSLSLHEHLVILVFAEESPHRWHTSRHCRETWFSRTCHRGCWPPSPGSGDSHQGCLPRKGYFPFYNLHFVRKYGFLLTLRGRRGVSLHSGGGDGSEAAWCIPGKSVRKGASFSLTCLLIQFLFVIHVFLLMCLSYSES